MKKNCGSENIKGFTLIELLVVVLIIGILAAIALPQYQKAVEKSRVAEVLQNAKVIEECFDWYILEHGLPSNGTVDLADMDCPMEINLGNLDEEDGGYKTENFWYEYVNCSRALGCMADIRRFPNNLYSFEVMVNPSSRRKKSKVCFTQFTDRGRSVCNGLRNQGWEYEEGEL